MPSKKSGQGFKIDPDYQAFLDENIRVNSLLEDAQVQAENKAAEANPRHDIRHPKTGRFIPAKTVPAQSNRVGYGTRPGVTATQ